VPNDSIQVKPGGMAEVRNLSDDHEIVVRFADSETVRHYPLKIMKIGAFKKTGYDLCPDWDRMAVTQETMPI
jgi:hypothetical protein